jgi:hypothetical protein
MHRLEPAGAHQLRKPTGVVLVGLIALRLQHPCGVMGLQQHHRNTALLQFAAFRQIAIGENSNQALDE